MLHLFVLLAALMMMISTQSMCLHCQVFSSQRKMQCALKVTFWQSCSTTFVFCWRKKKHHVESRMEFRVLSTLGEQPWPAPKTPHDRRSCLVFFSPTIPGHDLLHYFSPRRRISLLDDDGAELSLTHLLCFSPSPLLPCSSPPYASLTFSIGP